MSEAINPLKRRAENTLPVAEQPNPKVQKLELSLLERLPMEVQHYMFGFLIGDSSNVRLQDLASRDIVALTRVSKLLRSSVMSFFPMQVNSIIGPMLAAMSRIKTKRIAKESTLLAFEGLKSITAAKGEGLCRMEVPSETRIQAVIQTVIWAWEINTSGDERLKGKVRIKDCFGYFETKKIPGPASWELSDPDSARFVLAFLNIHATNKTLKRLFRKIIKEDFNRTKADNLNNEPQKTKKGMNFKDIISLSEGKCLKKALHVKLVAIFKTNDPTPDYNVKLEKLKKRHPEWLLGYCGHQNIALLAAKFGIASVFDWLLSQDDERFKALVTSQDAQGRNIVQITATYDHSDAFEWLGQPAGLEKLFINKDNQERTVAHLTCLNHAISVINLIWHYKNLQNLFYEKDCEGNTPLHYLFQWSLNENMLSNMWATQESLHKAFEQKNGAGRNIAHIAAGCENDTGFQWIMGQEGLFPLLLQKDNSGNNVAHYAIQENDQYILERIEADPRLQHLLTETNAEGQNIMHCAAKVGGVDAIMWISKRETLQHLADAVDAQGRNTAHLAAIADAPRILESIDKSDVSLQRLLDQLTHDGKNLKTLAIENRAFEVLQWIEERERRLAETEFAGAF